MLPVRPALRLRHPSCLEPVGWSRRMAAYTSFRVATSCWQWSGQDGEGLAAATSGQPLLEAMDLRVSSAVAATFPAKKVHVERFQGIAFKVDAGEAFLSSAVRGGQVDLRQCVVGLQKPTIFEIYFDARAALLQGRTACQIQMVFQDPYSSLNRG